MMELARVEIVAQWEERAASRHLGRALNAWFYRALAAVDERVADHLHGAPGTRPFSIALVEDEVGPTLVVGAGPPVAAVLGDVIERTMRGGRVALDGRWLRLERVALCRTATFASLMRQRLLHSSVPTAVRFRFLTPTAFHSRGRTLPLPLPELVFGGLLDRWHDWGGTPLGVGAPMTVEDCAALRRHRLRSVSVTMEGKLIAFVGEAEFTLVRPEPAYAGLLALLGDFAEFSGVGQKVAMGMGCVRVEVLDNRAGHASNPDAGTRRGRPTSTADPRDDGRHPAATPP